MEKTFEKNPDDLGAVWDKAGAKGKFLSGSITVNGEQIRIVMFPNDKKTSDTQPSWRILRAKPKMDAAASPSEISPEDYPL